MTEQPVIFKRTDLIYVYDSDDEKKRKKRDRKKKRRAVIKKENCGLCGKGVIKRRAIKITCNTFICIHCATYATTVNLDLK